MTPDDNRLATLTDDARASQERLARTSLAEHLEHAKRVHALATELKRVGAPIKESFEAAGIDYQLARHSIWVADAVARLASTYPALLEFGPSLVLLVREAERRFAREERLAELAELIAAIAGGMSRSAARERFMRPARRVSAADVLGALATGQLERAEELYEQCDARERARLDRVSETLPELVKREPVVVEAKVVPVASSIESAVRSLVPGDGSGFAPALLQPGYSE